MLFQHKYTVSKKVHHYDFHDNNNNNNNNNMKIYGAIICP